MLKELAECASQSPIALLSRNLPPLSYLSLIVKIKNLTPKPLRPPSLIPGLREASQPSHQSPGIYQFIILWTSPIPTRSSPFPMKSAGWLSRSLSCVDASSSLNFPLFCPNCCIIYAALNNDPHPASFAMAHVRIKDQA